MLSSLFICYFNYFNSSSICLLSLAQLSRIFISVYPSICWFIHLYYYIKVHLSIHLDWHSWLLCLSLFGYALLELFIFWKTQVYNIFIDVSGFCVSLDKVFSLLSSNFFFFSGDPPDFDNGQESFWYDKSIWLYTNFIFRWG